MSAQDAQVIQWIEANWIWVLIVFWIVVGGAGESLRRAIKERRQHQIDLALARRGIDPAARKVQVADHDEDDEDDDHGGEDDERALPAAVKPTPPGHRLYGGTPGQCRHERIVPVIGDDGELKRWICANYQRCDAEFDKSVAVYEPAGTDQEGTK